MKISLNLVWVRTGKIGGLSSDNNEKLWIIIDIWNKNDEADTNVIKKDEGDTILGSIEDKEAQGWSANKIQIMNSSNEDKGSAVGGKEGRHLKLHEWEVVQVCCKHYYMAAITEVIPNLLVRSLQHVQETKNVLVNSNIPDDESCDIVVSVSDVC